MYKPEMIDRVILYLKSKNISDKSITSIINRIHKISEEVQPLTQQNYLRFHTEILMKFSPSACNKYKQAMDHFCDMQGLDRFDIPRLQETARAKVTLTIDEIVGILDSQNDRYTPFIKILAYTGMRPGEIFALKDQHIDRANNVILIETSKTNKGRLVPLPDMKKIPLPFTFSDTALKKNINKRLQICGIKKKVTPYTFRHSYATRMLAEGVPLFIVQEIMGHIKADTTARYFHANAKMIQEACLLDPLRRKDISTVKIIGQLEQYIKKTVEGLDVDVVEVQEAITHLYLAIVNNQNNTST